MGIFTFNNLLSAVKTNGLSESFLPPMVLNMSITASVIILFVLLARLALKKAPKIFSYALWAVVLFRLLCPVSITTDFSLLERSFPWWRFSREFPTHRWGGRTFS